ncbi:hypothetical protein LZL87_014090 [Fusarium oxysporum]|nr:hypothetical protein LZL87_014090 [Fusarium oxysporum]
MKFQSILLGYVLLYPAQVSSLPSDFHRSLVSNTDSKNSTLEWSQCDLDFKNNIMNENQKGFDCARLEVPLDYTSASNGETIKLDLIRAKATEKPFMGSVLFNPGGPGGSGVESVLKRAEEMLPIFGGHYDVIGFDTRGTGRTIPFFCNKTGEGANATDKSELHPRDFNTLPQLDLWDQLKTEAWETSGTLAEVCFEASQDTGRFIGTPFVARDMISIVDALGQGPKLNYWGVSYGTILGQVAASMFPERIGRMILDSNLSADDYATTMWMSSLRDSERALANLFEDCVKVGSKMCSLADYHGKNTTGESLLRTFDEKFESLIRKSYDETNATKKEVILSGAVGFKSFILNELYSASDYPSVVSRVKGLFTGNDTAMFAPSEQEISSKWNPTGANAVYGISCSDSTFRAEDPDDLFSIYQAHLAEGSFSEVVTPSRFTCARWKFSAAEQIDVNKLRNVKTSFPILIINGKYDPVTSLSGAWETSARFRGSRLLVHEGVGHGLLNHPSNCTQDAITRYFVDGKMPKLNNTCSPNLSPFEYADVEAKKKEKQVPVEHTE